MICNPCKTAGELTKVLRRGELRGEPVRVIISLHAQCQGCPCQHQVTPEPVLRSEEAK